MFKLRTGIDIVHIGYKGWADCVRGLTGSEVDMMFDNLNTALPNISAGKIRPLAVAALKRHRSLPDVPTFDELGIRDADVTAWFGIMVPAGTPQPLIDRMGEKLKAHAANVDFQKLVHAQGLDVDFRGPQGSGKILAGRSGEVAGRDQGSGGWRNRRRKRIARCAMVLSLTSP